MQQVKFLLTAELGRLGRWLRLLGYDTVLLPAGVRKPSLFLQALQEDRVLLTRNRRLGASHVIRIVIVQSDHVRSQLAEITKALSLTPDPEEQFTRCLRCNAALEEIPRESVHGKVPPYVEETVQEFVQCPTCRQIFWSGTHPDLVDTFLRKISGPPCSPG